MGMQTIGLLGGMSWESSLEYYRLINQGVREKLGGFHSAKSVMVSVDFAEIEALQLAGEWAQAARCMIDAARHIERGGGDFLVICTNTMHLMADEVQENITIPLLHIADATAEEIVSQGQRRVGLLGTRFTMEGDFYRRRLVDDYGLKVLIPDVDGRKVVHDVIYNELVMGRVNLQSKEAYLRVISDLERRGAQGVILGCTEIGLLVGQDDVDVLVFDTTRIHATATVEYALGERSFEV
jgi:aspartate racemase